MLKELCLSSWTLGWTGLFLCHKKEVILTQGSPLNRVSPAVFSGTPPAVISSRCGAGRPWWHKPTHN